jgi:hypothetical protein
MAKPSFERRTVHLTQEVVRKAQSLVASGQAKGKIIEWADDKEEGLCLRLTTRACASYLRLRAKSVKLSDAGELTVDEARRLASAAKLAWRQDVDPRMFVDFVLARRREGLNLDAAINDAWDLPTDAECKEMRVSRIGSWTWSEMTVAFHAHKLGNLKGRWKKQYTKYLLDPAFDPIADMYVTDVGIRELEQVRERLLETSKRSRISRALNQTKEMMSWAWSERAGPSGLADTQYEWWTRLRYSYKSTPRDHTPLICDLARTLVVAERCRGEPGDPNETSNGTLAALFAVVLTAQRTGALLLMRRRRLFDHPTHPGWKVMNWTAAEMKGATQKSRPHSVPLPPAALEMLERVNPGCFDGDWVFQSPKNSSHVTQSALNRLLYRLEGRSFTKPKPNPTRGPKPRDRTNLLDQYAIEPWTPHDARRTMASFFDDIRLGGAGSALLGHVSRRDDDDRQRVADVTRIHYARSQRLDLKTEGMEKWVAAVIAAYEEESAAFNSTLPSAPPNRTSRRSVP